MKLFNKSLLTILKIFHQENKEDDLHMSMQIIFPFVANPASQMPKSVFLSKLSYEHPAKGRLFFCNLTPFDTIKVKGIHGRAVVQYSIRRECYELD